MRASAVTLLLLLAHAAHAEPARPLRFEYHRDANAHSCPDEAALRSAVAARLGFDPFEASAPAALTVNVAAHGAGFRAEISLDEEGAPPKHRQLDATQADCADLASALPFALSVAVESFSAQPQPRAKLAEPPKAAPERVVENIAAPAAPPAAQPWFTRASARTALLVGAAPTYAFSAAAGAGVAWQRLSLSGEARFVFPSGKVVSTGRVDVSSVAFEAVPCGHVGSLALCGLLGGGVTWSWASNLADPTSAVTPQATAGARVELRLPLSAVELLAFAELRAALVYTRLKVGADEVWATPPISGGFGLGIAFGGAPINP